MQSLKLLFNAITNPPVSEFHTIEPIYILFFVMKGLLCLRRPLNITTLFLFCLIHHHAQKQKSVAGL